MDTFAPAVLPTINGTSMSESARTINSNFGDGYNQDSPDGLNCVVGKAQLNWTGISPANFTYLWNFFKGHVGQSFLWTPPFETAPRCWICNGWQRTYPGPNTIGFTATFDERFTFQ